MVLRACFFVISFVDLKMKLFLRREIKIEKIKIKNVGGVDERGTWAIAALVTPVKPIRWSCATKSL